MCVGVNWSGARLTGYDITPDDVRSKIEDYLDGRPSKV
jgi:hypothetical protein